jgi:regulator of sirC expression with transglutaminase-like and TPR domain
MMRRPDEALADCNASLRLRPDDPDALDHRALAYWLLGDQHKARQDLDHARQIDPSYPAWQDRFHGFEGMF